MVWVRRTPRVSRGQGGSSESRHFESELRSVLARRFAIALTAFMHIPRLQSSRSRCLGVPLDGSSYVPGHRRRDGSRSNLPPHTRVVSHAPSSSSLVRQPREAVDSPVGVRARTAIRYARKPASADARQTFPGFGREHVRQPRGDRFRRLRSPRHESRPVAAAIEASPLDGQSLRQPRREPLPA
jgi:hypothetical protein